MIPAYNPDHQLVLLVKGLLQIGDMELIVVNDGSAAAADPFFTAVRELFHVYGRGIVIDHKENMGKGAAIKTAVEYCRKNEGFRNMVFASVDADGQHSIKDIIRILDVAEQAEHEDAKRVLVLGCRQFAGEVPFRSRFGNYLTKLLFRLITGATVSDTQTGLRAFSRTMLDFLANIPGDRYEYEMNVLLHGIKEGVKMEEIWIDTVYLDDNRSSHFRVVRDSFKIYACLLRFIGSSLCGFCVDYILYVFQMSSGSARTLGKYAALALAIWLINTFVLSVLTLQLEIGRMAAKLICEIFLFSVSFLVQRNVIFRVLGTVRK